MKRSLTSALLVLVLSLGQLAAAATTTRPFNMNLGPGYSGLASTISYKVVLVDGSVPIGPITATGITEGSYGAYTATGSYTVNLAIDSAWSGKVVMYESTNSILYEEPFASRTLADGSITTATFAAGATVPAVAAVNDKAGYSLSAGGLDQIPVGDPGPVSQQTTFPKRMMAVWRRWFGPTQLTKTGPGGGQLKTIADDGVTVNTVQGVVDDGTTQTVGKAQ